MSRPGDTNPHFVRPIPPQFQGQHPQTSSPHDTLVPLPQQGLYSEPFSRGPGWPEPQRPGQSQPVEPARRGRSRPPGRRSGPLGRLVSFHPRHEEQPPQANRQGQQTQPLVPSVPTPPHGYEDHEHFRTKNQGQHSRPLDPLVPTQHPDHDDQQHPRKKHQGQHTRPLVPSGRTPPHDDEHQQHPQPHGSQGQPQRHGQRAHPHGLLRPRHQETNLFTWSFGICCAIFCIIIIITGLVVLIIYLVFRPRTPKFDVTAATLNAAYLDMGYLLNADITVLANFTNPNKKVSVDFSYLVIDLYYGSTLLATQAIEPFSAQKRKSMFANVHMVVSQVRLGLLESQRLKKQMETSRAVFEVKGYFRARANFGRILRYSYWLHGDCKVVFTRPPDGILVGRKCKTKN